jgi:5-hydroxyisourate hydrolase-like protein (transthyretin family)
VTSVLILALLLAQQTTPPEKCSLSGTVVDSTTGQPLDRVRVVAEHRHGDEPGASTTTDAKGEFELVELDPGDYRLSLSRNGYLDTYYGDARASDYDGSTITLKTGQTIEGIHAKLTPFGVIGGTVRDSEGEPAAGVTVQIYASRYRGRRREVETQEEVTTDDLGHYRIAKLPAGRYYVAAIENFDEQTPTVDHSARPANRSGVPVTTFYPGATDPSAATAVELVPGTRNTGVDITLISSRVHTLIVHTRTDTGLSASAILRYADNGFSERVGHGRSVDKQTIEIAGIPDGTYVLDYGAYVPGKQQNGVIDLTASPDGCKTSMPVSIGKEEVQELNVVASGCAEVTGHIVLEDGVRLKPSVGFPYAIIIDGNDADRLFMKDDGTFRMTIAPGIHTLDFQEASEENGLYVRGIRSTNQEFLRTGIPLSGGEHIDLEVLLASDGGRVEGVVSDSDGKPAPGARVVLIPNETALRTRIDYTHDVITDHAGHFEIKAAAPGDYKLFAFGDIEKESWFDPDVLRDFEAKGTAVSVTAKDPNAKDDTGQTVNLTLIR